MNITKAAVVGLCVAGLTACGGDDTTRDTVATRTDTVGAPAAEAPGTMQRDQMDGMERIDMSPVGQSNVSGEASLAQDGQSTRVMVTLNGSTPGQKQGHIHQGTCDNIGAVAFPLEPIDVQQGGTGTSTSTVAASPQQIMEGEHVIAYHEAGGNPGRPVVCGNIGRGGVFGL